LEFIYASVFYKIVLSITELSQRVFVLTLVETHQKNPLVNPRWSCEGIQGLPGELIRIIRDSLGTPGGS
jgi:hypothetical protein